MCQRKSERVTTQMTYDQDDDIIKLEKAWYIKEGLRLAKSKNEGEDISLNNTPSVP